MLKLCDLVPSVTHLHACASEDRRSDTAHHTGAVQLSHTKLDSLHTQWMEEMCVACHSLNSLTDSA